MNIVKQYQGALVCVPHRFGIEVNADKINILMQPLPEIIINTEDIPLEVLNNLNFLERTLSLKI